MPPIRTRFTIVCLVAACFPGHAGTGRVTFAGRIDEATCPMRDAEPACRGGRPVPATVRRIDGDLARREPALAALDQAMARDPSVAWILVETTYR